MAKTPEKIIFDLLKELSSELDLHYEERDFRALGPTIEPMRTAAAFLETQGHPLPAGYAHLVRRYYRHRI